MIGGIGDIKEFLKNQAKKKYYNYNIKLIFVVKYSLSNIKIRLQLYILSHVFLHPLQTFIFHLPLPEVELIE